MSRWCNIECRNDLAIGNSNQYSINTFCNLHPVQSEYCPFIVLYSNNSSNDMN